MSMLALALAIVCLYPAARFIYRCDPRLPTVALFCGMHAFMFTLPALTNPHVMPDLVPGPVSLSGFQVSHALAVCWPAFRQRKRPSRLSLLPTWRASEVRAGQAGQAGQAGSGPGRGSNG